MAMLYADLPQINSSIDEKTNVIPDPFVLYSTTAMPRDMDTVLRLCEYLWLTMGSYKSALQRVGRYFLTKVIFDSVSDAEREKYEDFFENQLQIKTCMAEIVDDFLCYGNSFTSLYFPFNRILICVQCKTTRNIMHIKDGEIKLNRQKKMFEAMCPKCRTWTLHNKKDFRSSDQARVNLIRWNPHEMRLIHDLISGQSEFLWTMTAAIQSHVKSNRSFWLRRLPWEFLEASLGSGTFQFFEDEVYHIKEPTLAGVLNHGWGIPRTLSVFKDSFYVQLLKRFNEAFALDYIVPVRVVTPARASAIEPAANYDLSNWKWRMTDILSKHRRDPSGWNMIPFPIDYKVLGSEGLSMSPFQLIKQGQADMMDGIGVPLDLFQGTLQLQAAPTAIRLFESCWPHLTGALNNWLNWVMQKVSMLFGWEPAHVKLSPPSYADDLERKGILFQLAGMGQISRQTAYASVGLDPAEEQRRILSESKKQLELTREAEQDEIKRQELDMAIRAVQEGSGSAAPIGMSGMPGGMAGIPGQPGAQAQQGPVTPQDILTQGRDVAAQFMALDMSSRNSQLRQLKTANPLLHSVVKQTLEDMETQAGQEGIQQARQVAASQPAVR